MNNRPAFGKKPAAKAALPAPVSPRAIAESTVREWTGRGAIPAAALVTVDRLAREVA
jgi:hypothetical protein